MLIYFDEYSWMMGVILLGLLLPFLWQKKRNWFYLFAFSIFWMYILVVVQFVIFPIAITTTSNINFLPRINLIPFYFGVCSMPEFCVRDIIENIILTIPFGFGINFLVRLKARNTVYLAITVGFIFELTQFIISFLFKSGSRSTDINDVIFNAIGVLLGYGCFRAFSWIFVKLDAYFDFKHKWLFAEIYKHVFQAQTSSKTKNV